MIQHLSDEGMRGKKRGQDKVREENDRCVFWMSYDTNEWMNESEAEEKIMAVWNIPQQTFYLLAVIFWPTGPNFPLSSTVWSVEDNSGSGIRPEKHNPLISVWTVSEYESDSFPSTSAGESADGLRGNVTIRRTDFTWMLNTAICLQNKLEHRTRRKKLRFKSGIRTWMNSNT